MKYANILARFTSSFWLIQEDSLIAIANLIEARINSVAALPMRMEDGEEGDDDEESDDREQYLRQGVAVVDVQGILGKRLAMMETACGGCDYDAVTRDLESELSSPLVRAVVMRFDSPGGTVTGCPEAYAKILALRASSGKQIIAYTDTRCCSAAYWLASACDAIFATQSATLGSTGTIAVLRDESAANAAKGVKFHVFKSGSMKDIGATYRPPSEDEVKVLQARTAEIGAAFRDAVVSQRPQVAGEVFETAMFYTGTQALALGLADKLVPDLQAVVSELSGL